MFFVDAAHLVLGAFLSMVLWCLLARVWIRVPWGRQRFNVLGALDAATQEVIPREPQLRNSRPADWADQSVR